MAGSRADARSGDPLVAVTDARCRACGGRLEPTWSACGWCGQRVDVPPVEDAGGVGGRDAAGPVDGSALGPGTLLLGRYRIDAVLGRGGFGITYRARDTRLHRDVAVKELFPPPAIRRSGSVTVAEPDRHAFAEARTRFQREAAALARFNHPGIVRIFEVFEANNTAYLVMELIQGASVGALLQTRGTPFGVDEVLDTVLRVGDALGAVHDAGLLHRDINPSNLMVDGSQRVVLIDFGLARAYGDDISGSVTRAVTPGYAPPEQYAGSARSGPACDVFGLAATAYKLLTGATPTNVFDRQAGTPLPAPIALQPGIPPMVSAAILDGMELDADHRPATAQAFLDRLGLHGEEPGRRVLLVDPGGTGVPESVGSGHDPAGAPVRADRPVAAVGVAVPPVVQAAPPAVPAPTAGAARPVVPRAAQPVAPPNPGPPAGVRMAPWHGEPPAVTGDAHRRRGWVTWPAGVALVVMASASPLVVAAVVALVVSPGLATLGDVEVHRHRRRTGTQHRRWHTTGLSVVVPVRFVRNLVVAVARALPAVAIGAIGYATERVVTEGGIDTAARELTIRLTGAAMALVLLLPARHGGRGFRTDLGSTVWANWAMEGRDRPGIRAIVVVIVAVALTAAGAWLRPELWPLT